MVMMNNETKQGRDRQRQSDKQTDTQKDTMKDSHSEGGEGEHHVHSDNEGNAPTLPLCVHPYPHMHTHLCVLRINNGMPKKQGEPGDKGQYTLVSTIRVPDSVHRFATSEHRFPHGANAC